MDTRDELWASLINEALDRAPCNLSETVSTCRVNYRYTPWYASFQHLDEGGPIDDIKVVSVHTLMTTKREVVVARLALWLTRLHDNPTLSAALTSGDGRAADWCAASASATSSSSGRRSGAGRGAGDPTAA